MTPKTGFSTSNQLLKEENGNKNGNKNGKYKNGTGQ